MRQEETIFDAITGIREELVEEAQEYRFRRRKPVWTRYGQMAACLALAAALCFGIYGLSQVRMGGADSDCVSTDANGSDAPPASLEGAEPEDGVSGGGTGSDAGEPLPNPEAPAGRADFTGVVLEVQADSLLVERHGGGTVEVPTSALEDLPEFREGDVVNVLCAEVREEEGGAAASGVERIDVIEP